MPDTVITLEHVAKRYRLGSVRHDTFRDRLVHAIKSPFRGAPAANDAADFWALRDISFEVKRGEVLGVIGRNGAGKSTLLKILSRITEPTQGRVSIRGRVASLLEVGTGFHPELTGRENIFLNGAILGMSRQEIRAKFDAIVGFAEVDRFLDTPVKHYSSGMYVRLAFSVAAHLDPEILIIDEVLAVGDAQFQSRCLGRMNEVANSGRTVLFVSHNMSAVQHLCSRCVYLKQGHVVMDGDSASVVMRYLSGNESGSPKDNWNYIHRSNDLTIEAVDVLVDGQPANVVRAGDTVTFSVTYACPDPGKFPNGIECSFVVFGAGQRLANFWSEAGTGQSFKAEARRTVTCTVPDWPFRALPMSVQVSFSYQRQMLVEIGDAVQFSGADSDRFGTGIIPHSSEGIVLLPHRWEGPAAASPH